jgi:hypothetical protein
VIPGVVTRFEGNLDVVGKRIEGVPQGGEITAECGRQLKEHWTQFLAKVFGPLD